MPLKICPRFCQIVKSRSSASSHRTKLDHTPLSAALLAGTPHTGDDRSRRGFWSSSRGFWSPRFAVGGVATAVGAWSTSQLFDEAYCEGGEMLVTDALADSTLSDIPSKIHRHADSVRKRIFFMYERRIRAYSSPEKVFDYFASIKESKDEFYMTPGDLMRAIIPVLPPSESSALRGGYLTGERDPGELQCVPSDFFLLFDTNGDGRISFEEYNFIRTLLITSLESFVATFKMFDRNGDGFVDMKEFQKVMQLMREKNKEKIVRSGSLLPSRRFLDSSKNIKLLKYLFGSDGQHVLQYHDFIKFLGELHEEILRLEFSHYDCHQQGSIPAQDFASSMVAAASMSNVNRYLNRVDALAKDPAFRGVRISYQDFEWFSKLRKQRKLLAISAYAVDSLNGFSKQDFRWATSKVCQVDLSDAALDVIFYIFDSNGDGMLSLTEFLDVQDLREIAGVDPLQPGLIRILRCMWNCMKENCDPRLHG